MKKEWEQTRAFLFLEHIFMFDKFLGKYRRKKWLNTLEYLKFLKLYCLLVSQPNIIWTFSELWYSICSSLKLKIPHMGNSWSSRMCVILEYRYDNMNLSQYHGRCQYHNSMSIPWGFANTMSQCLYHESMSKQ